MAEPLKNSFGPEVPRAIAAMFRAVDPAFQEEPFLAEVLRDYETLELTPRARRISSVLRTFLPADAGLALERIVEAVSPGLREQRAPGMAGFVFLPLVFFVSDHGLDHFEEAMRAQHVLTRLFTAEFSIRAFLDREPERTLARLHEWAGDPDVHVRRLVSEGTRPRLPWARRLPRFQTDPEPVLELLERLKDDPELYVRRSVANNLNDIARDNPDTVVAVCRRWMKGAGPERRALVRHALRSLVKEGRPDALAVLGFDVGTPVEAEVVMHPSVGLIGEKIRIEVTVGNPGAEPASVAVDLRVQFRKARGGLSAKVFKGAELHLGPGEGGTVRKTVSLAQHTTRRHYPGEHRVEVLANGGVVAVRSFQVVESP